MTDERLLAICDWVIELLKEAAFSRNRIDLGNRLLESQNRTMQRLDTEMDMLRKRLEDETRCKQILVGELQELGISYNKLVEDKQELLKALLPFSKNAESYEKTFPGVVLLSGTGPNSQIKVSDVLHAKAMYAKHAPLNCS